MSENDTTAHPHRRVVPAGQWKPVDIDDLEPAAWDALRHSRSSAVTAGPGAGKTEFLAQRATYLLQTGTCPPPRRILAISYKRDSAKNLQRRVAARVPDEAHRFVSMTFDAFTKGLVDRFARSLPAVWRLDPAAYEVKFWNDRMVRGFLTTLAGSAPQGLRRDLFALPANRFLSDVVGTWPLPAEANVAPKAATEFAAWSWWKEQYLGLPAPAVDFTMLNRLAEFLVRTNPRLLRALRATYPFVFVDEFQDTTGAQITFLKTVFGHPGIVTTAVGDGKQRIMRFAGALDDAMGRYEKDFGARRFELAWNFRSSAELVAAQHHVASQLEPAVVRAVSKARAETGHVPLSIWTYVNARRQAEHIAQWIADDTATSTRVAADFALMARQRVADLEPLLAAALNRRGIALRNDDTMYGKLRLQDLLKHDVTRMVLGVLQLAAQDRGLPAVWTETSNLLSRVRGGDHGAVAARRTVDHLGAFTSTLRLWLNDHTVAAADAREVVNRAASIVETGELAGFVRGEQTGDEVELVLDALAARLTAVADSGRSWAEVFADVPAQDAVTLLTIHRSKGLEYHTVIVIDLDDQQWWSYARDVQEATSTFFVGLSRAAHRIVFTCTRPDPRQGGVGGLYMLLDAAGAEEQHWP